MKLHDESRELLRQAVENSTGVFTIQQAVNLLMYLVQRSWRISRSWNEFIGNCRNGIDFANRLHALEMIISGYLVSSQRNAPAPASRPVAKHAVNK